MRIVKIAKWTIGTAIFLACAWYLYSGFHWAASMSVLWAAELWWLVPGVSLAYLPYLLIRGVRWQIMIREKGSTSPFIVAYFTNTLALGLAMVSPGQLGEVLKIEAAKRYGGLGRGLGAGAFLVERLVDIIVLAAIAVIGLFLYGHVANVTARLAGIAPEAFGLLVAIAAVPIILIATSKARVRWFERILNAGLGKAFPSPIVLAQIIMLSIAGWILIAFCWRAALMSVRVHLALDQAAWLVAVVAMAQFLSFVPGGIGPSDVVTIQMLHFWGFGADQSLAGAIALRAMGLPMIVIALSHWPCWMWMRSRVLDTADDLRAIQSPSR